MASREENFEKSLNITKRDKIFYRQRRNRQNHSRSDTPSQRTQPDNRQNTLILLNLARRNTPKSRSYRFGYPEPNYNEHTPLDVIAILGGRQVTIQFAWWPVVFT